MIKRLILVGVLLMFAAGASGQVGVDLASKQVGKYTNLTNTVANIFGLDTVAINGLTSRIVYAINSAATDTSYSIDKAKKEFYKRPAVTNKHRMIFGNDTVVVNGLTADFVYLLNPTEGVSTSADNTWTGIQTYSTLIADLVITNRVDSTTSIRLYDTSGVLYALFSADTSYIPNLTVGNLNSTTIINGSSVTTNSLISDTLISNSPLHLRTDSLFFGVLNDTSKVWYNELLYSGNKRRGAIYPNVDYGMNLGLYNKRIDTVNARVIKLGSGTSAIYNYNTSILGFRGSLIFNTEIYTTAGNPLVAGEWNPYSDVNYNLGTTVYKWKNTYTRTLNADSVIFSKQILAPNGSSTAPSYSFTNKTTKGMYLIDTGNVGINGNLTINGALTSTNYAYGSAYIADDNPDSIVVSSSSVYYTVGAKQGANGYKLTSGGVLKNVTVQDSSITVGVAGNYEVSYSFSFRTVTGVTSGRFNWYIFVNDTKQEKTGAKRLMSGTNDLGIGSTAPTVLTLAANDVIKLKLLSPDDNSNTVAFDYCIIHVKKIDN